jgi:hypothetical protein
MKSPCGRSPKLFLRRAPDAGACGPSTWRRLLRLTSRPGWDTMRAVRDRKTLTAALLLLAIAMVPELVWAGTHWLDHHGHGVEADSARNLTQDLAEVLVHGHDHPEGTPDHEHNVLLSPSIRQDAPASPPVSEAAPLESPACEISGTASGWQPPRLAGPSPPRLHLFCTLLI